MRITAAVSPLGAAGSSRYMLGPRGGKDQTCIVSDTGEGVLVEVAARRPSLEKLQEIISRPMSLSEFLQKVIEIDLDRLSDKLRDQAMQLQSNNCILVAGWHTSIGMSLLVAIQGSTSQVVRRVEELQGMCIYSSRAGRRLEHALLCVKV